MGIEENAVNGMIVSGGLRTGIKNTPKQYADRQRQYFGEETARFVQNYARYGTDFVTARVQGLCPNAPDSWDTVRVRLADIAPGGVSTLRKLDDYKILLFESASIDYIRPGSKLETMGSTWLVTNPQNLSGAVGETVVQRCNAVYNRLDWYGNVVSEPVCLEKALAMANNSDMQDYALITQGYFNIRCQKNDATANLDTNSRMILGKGAYRLTGVTDFLQEFTGDYDSVRMMEFTARYEPPNAEIDDLARHVAGGKTFLWEILLRGEAELRTGQTMKLGVTNRRCGEYVTGTAEQPIDYFWRSSDEKVATVAADGTITGVGSGDVTVTCILAQNPEITAQYSLRVDAQGQTPEVIFTGNVPKTLCAFESVTLTAAYFDESGETDEAVTFSFSGADTAAYTADAAGNSVTITCWSGATQPLVVTAQCAGARAEKVIELEGI